MTTVLDPTLDPPLDPTTSALVAIGAAVAANCQPCLTHHVAQARALGVGDAALAEAVAVAQRVKEAPARAISELAATLVESGGAGGTVAEVAVQCPDAVAEEPVAAAPAAGACC